MATVKIMPYAYTEDKDLNNLCNYIINPEKTNYGYYTLGRGVEPLKAYEDFCELQSLYQKKNGRRAYHIIVSYDPKFAFCAEDGLALAYAISNYFFPNYQVICGVHPYQEVLHAHFAVNPVSLNPGITQKLHIHPQMLFDFKNRICIIEQMLSEGKIVYN